MNPSVGGWNNPPPPGTEVAHEDDYEPSPAPSKTKPMAEDPHKLRSIDRIDPFLKNPEYLEYEKRVHSRHRRRSYSRPKYSDRKDKRYRSRSRSRERHRRSRSRDRRHHRHRSPSRSPSASRSRYSRSKKERRHKRSSSRSRRRSRSCSRSHSRSRSHRSHRKSRHSKGREDGRSESDRDDHMNVSGEVDEDDDSLTKENAFKNDGSFLEMFKKMQEEQQKAAEAAKEAAAASEAKKPMPAFGKRRGGRVLKTGLVEKTKLTEEEPQPEGLDAWTVYMKEVKRYKEACCDDDSKTRPLVK